MRKMMSLKYAFLLLLLLWLGTAGVTHLTTNGIDSHNTTSSSNQHNDPQSNKTANATKQANKTQNLNKTSLQTNLTHYNSSKPLNKSLDINHLNTSNLSSSNLSDDYNKLIDIIDSTGSNSSITDIYGIKSTTNTSVVNERPLNMTFELTAPAFIDLTLDTNLESLTFSD